MRGSYDGTVGFDLGVWANYSAGALDLQRQLPGVPAGDQGCSAGSVRSRPVAHLATLNLIPSITFGRRFQLSLDLPVTLAVGDAIDPTTFRPVGGDANPQGRTSFALGDPRVELKARVAGEGMRGTGFAISAWGNIPTGQYTGGDQRFISDGQFSGGARAIVDFRYGHFSAAVNAGAIFRMERAQVLTTTVGTRMLWGVGLGYDVTAHRGARGVLEQHRLLLDAAVERGGGGDLAAQSPRGGLPRSPSAAARASCASAGASAAQAFAGMVWSPYPHRRRPRRGRRRDRSLPRRGRGPRRLRGLRRLP
ncbi:MAG: hypothetical protein U0325_18560 [Polyangiales bacterium]